MRNSWGWGLPSYRQYETEDEPSRHEAPVYVPQSPSMAGRVPQSPSLMGRRHSMSAGQFPDTPKQRPLQRPMQSPTFLSKVSKVQDRICVSSNTFCTFCSFECMTVWLLRKMWARVVLCAETLFIIYLVLCFL